MLVVGGVAGLVVWALSDAAAFAAWWADGAGLIGPDAWDAWEAMAWGVLYTVVMWSSFLGARRLLHRWLPIRTWKQAAAHTVGLGVVAQLGFGAVYLVERLVCWWMGWDLHKGTEGEPSLLLVSVVAFGFTALCASLTYAFDFYTRAREAEQAAVRAELSALRAQIDPHFLFNTLNAIAALIRTRPSEAEGVTERLADLFRYTLRASKQPAATLAEEVEAARLYAEIEQARFRDRMEVVWEIHVDAHGATLPSLTLQPLVENAVKHGVARTEGACAVLVRARRIGDEIELTVRDTGPGFDLSAGEAVFGRGTGLANVRDRQRLHFGPAAHFDLLPDGVRLRFPYWQTVENDAAVRPAVA
jgi:signal transduction histidine kinase